MHWHQLKSKSSIMQHNKLKMSPTVNEMKIERNENE